MSQKQDPLSNFKDTGIALMPYLFSAPEMARVAEALPPLLAEKSERVVLEKDGTTVRTVYAPHLANPLFAAMARHPRLLEPARKILGGDVYLYQCKINVKAAFAGDVWQWHQDYIYWQREDGMPKAQAVNAMVFLDKVTEFNGPLYLIPSSHHEGVLDVPPKQWGGPSGVERREPYRDKPAWMANLVADLKYEIRQETIRRLEKKFGVESPKGDAGSVLWFDSNTVHASPPNLSSMDRKVLMFTYNRCDNAPNLPENPRPEFLVTRDPTALTAVPDSVLTGR